MGFKKTSFLNKEVSFWLRTAELRLPDTDGQTALVIDVATPTDSNIGKNEHEKLEKDRGWRQQWSAW